MRRIPAVVVAALIAAASLDPLGAQQLRGTVADSVASVRLPGAVVTIVDSAGVAGARTITDGSGQFTLARSPRAARLRVIRIGYQPRDVPLSAATPSGGFAITMVRVPPLLDAVRVSDQELCPGGTDQGAAFAVWEQARAGLLSSVVANEANPPTATTRLVHRRVSATDGIVQSQQVEIRRGRTPRPFTSAASPESFAEHGYVAEDQSGRTYYAPDAEVLLDESFVMTHCFRLRPADAEHKDQIGLAFAPSRGRDTLVDVSGVIWIDRATPQLLAVEFLYTGLEPAAGRANVGGQLGFRTLPNGASFVERWMLRLPVLTRLPSSPSTGQLPPPGASRRQSQTDMRVLEIQEAGGQIANAKWQDGLEWNELPAGIGGVVTQQPGDASVPGAIVTLAGTRDSATTDALGQFTLAPLLPGRYTALAIDTSRAPGRGLRRTSQTVEVARGEIVIIHPRLAAPQRATRATGSVTRVISGVVSDTAHHPVTGVNVIVRDQAAAITDDSGRFRLQVASGSDAILDARRLGFAPSRFGLSAGGDTTIDILLLPTVQRLATVEVTESSTLSPNLRGFEQRARERIRGTGSGYFITADEIAKRNAVFTTQLFQTIPSLRVLRTGGSGNFAVFGISRTIRDGAQCPAAVYIDGIKIPDGGEYLPLAPLDTTHNDVKIDPRTGLRRREPGVPIDQLVMPGEIAGIEVYPSGVGAPPQFQLLNGTCAVVVIWTK